jgi:hypothetical protein
MPDPSSIPHGLRLGGPEDHPYVVSSWVESDRQHQGTWREAKARVRAILARRTVVLRICHVEGDLDAILGWAVLEAGKPVCVHYCYVRYSARKFGLARQLLGDVVAPCEYSHHSSTPGLKIPEGWTHNPQRAEQ